MLLLLTQKRVFFVQDRAGKSEVPFGIYKFCTMHDEKNEIEDRSKARITPLGKWLREYSLDEIPNFINVIKGDMSIVGPRPLYPEYSQYYSDAQRKRFEVLPGITGWAQINGRNAITFNERFKLDSWYAMNRTFLLDLKIMFKTPLTMLRTREVYFEDETMGTPFNGKN